MDAYLYTALFTTIAVVTPLPCYKHRTSKHAPISVPYKTPRNLSNQVKVIEFEWDGDEDGPSVRLGLLLVVHMWVDERMLDQVLPHRAPLQRVPLQVNSHTVSHQYHPALPGSGPNAEHAECTHRVPRKDNERALVPLELELLDLDVALHVDPASVLRPDAHADHRRPVFGILRKDLLCWVLLHVQLGQRVLDEAEHRVRQERGEEAREVRRVAVSVPALDLRLFVRGRGVT